MVPDREVDQRVHCVHLAEEAVFGAGFASARHTTPTNGLAGSFPEVFSHGNRRR